MQISRVIPFVAFDYRVIAFVAFDYRVIPFVAFDYRVIPFVDVVAGQIYIYIFMHSIGHHHHYQSSS